MKTCRICGTEYTQDIEFCSIPCMRMAFCSKNNIDTTHSQTIAYMQISDKAIAIDYDDIPKLYNKKWSFDTAGNITNLYEGKRIYLARYIMDCPKGKYVLHKSGNKLDNRKCNLIVSDYKTMKGMGE